MNSVILMGRFTRDPEVRVAQSGMSVATFTVAVDRAMTKEKKEQAERNGQPTADFIRCMAFGNTADAIGRFFTKGRKILIEGHIQTGKYENQQGQTVFTTDVIVGRFYFVDSQQTQQTQPQGNYQQNYRQPAPQPMPQPAPQPQQTRMDDDLIDGFSYFNEDDIPF